MVVSAAFGGFGPGLLATVLCSLESVYFAVEPLHSFAMRDPQHWLGLFMAVLSGVLTSAGFELLRRSQQIGTNLAALLDQTYDAVIIWDIGTKGITFWNKGAADLYGYSQTEALGRSPRDLLRTEFPDSHAAVETALRAGAHWNGILLHRTADGRPIVVESRMTARRSDGAIEVMEVNRDITARIEAAAAARQANEERERHVGQLEAVLDTMVEGLVVSNLEGLTIHWNPAALAMHGYRSLEECRRRLPEFADTFELSTGEGILPLDQWPLARVLRGETLRDYEVRVKDLRTSLSRVLNSAAHWPGTRTAIRFWLC